MSVCAFTFMVINCLQHAYVQILLRDAVRHPWPLNENVPVFDTLSRIYTGSFYLFDLASFVISFDLKDSLVLPQGLFGIWPQFKLCNPSLNADDQ